MIKKYYDITLSDYDIMERIGKITQFKKWYNPFPVILFIGQINKQIETLIKMLNNSNIDRELEKEIWKTESLLKINLLQANYYGVVNILKLQTKNAIFASYHKRIERKIKLNSKSLERYIENINKLTGIKIKTIDDIEKVYRKLQFLIDKYNINFKSDKNKDEKVYLMDIAIGVFSYLNQTVNPKEHTVLYFIAIRDKAIEQSEKLKESKSA